MIKKYLKIGAWVFIAGYLVVSLGIIAFQEKARTIESYQVVFQDTSKGFVTHTMVDTLLEHEFQISTATQSQLDIARMEDTIRKIPGVKHAEIYSEIGGHLVIEIEKETPILRVMDANHACGYISASGRLIPCRRHYLPRLAVANGHFRLPDELNGQQVQSNKELHMLYETALYIQQYPFWQAQIEQLYINQQGDLELIPRVGAHIIILGDTRQLEWKFEKLYVMYTKGFKIKDWNRYEFINLKYGNQVICTKR